MAGAKVVRVTARFHCQVPRCVAPDGVTAMERAKETVRGGNLDRYDTFAAFYYGTERVVGANGLSELVHVVDIVANKEAVDG